MDWYICLRRLNVGPILVRKISIEYILWKSQVRNVCWYLQSEHINLKLYIWENICMGKYSNVINSTTLGTHLNWYGHNIHILFNLHIMEWVCYFDHTFSDPTLLLCTCAGWKHSSGSSVNLIMAWMEDVFDCNIVIWSYISTQNSFLDIYLFINPIPGYWSIAFKISW